MNRKTLVKLLLDVCMTILYLLLVFDINASSFFHEVAGIGIGFIFLLHVLLNRKMMQALHHGYRAKRLSFVKTVLYFSDLILPVGMILVIATGIVISQALFSFALSLDLWMLLFNIHDVASYVCLGILGLHLLLHARYLKGVVRTMWEKRPFVQMKRVFAGFATTTAIVCLCYFIAFSAYKEQLFTESIALADTETGSETTQETTLLEEPLSLDPQGDEISTSETTEQYSSEQLTPSDDTTGDIPDLTTFLSTMFCQGCSNHCPLLNLRCAKGQIWLEQANDEYKSLYGTVEEL